MSILYNECSLVQRGEIPIAPLKNPHNPGDVELEAGCLSPGILDNET
jgi:hypothetical protein